MKNNKVNYVVVGVFVLAMLGAAIAAISVLSGRTGPTDTYFTSYRDVTGIKFGTKVLYMGFPVGQVEEITPHWSDTAELTFELELAVSSEWSGRIPDDSVAEIKSAGLLAAIAIDIRGGESREAIKPGGRFIGKQQVNLFAAMTETANTVRDLTEDDLKPLIKNVTSYVDSFGSVLQTDGSAAVQDLASLSHDLAENAPEIIQSVLDLSKKINDTATRLDKILGPENAAKVDTILSNTATATGNVVELTEDEKLEEILVNIRSASANLDGLTGNANRRLDDLLGEATVSRVRTTLDNIAEAAQNVAQLSRDLRATRDKLGHFIETLDKIATENRPDLRQTVKNARHTMESIAHHIDTITYNLEGTSRNMNEFSRQLRQNPGLLLGGGAPSDAASLP